MVERIEERRGEERRGEERRGWNYMSRVCIRVRGSYQVLLLV